MSAPNYAEGAYELLNAELGGQCEPELLVLYTLLMLTKGTETTLRNVHDAWSLWRMTTQPGHKSLVPFHHLTPEVQELARPYMDAIHRAARTWHKSVFTASRSSPSPGAPDVQTPEREAPQAPAPAAVQGGTAGAGYVCATPDCGHGRASHDLARDKRTRTACSVSTGKKATPCPCTKFTPQKESP